MRALGGDARSDEIKEQEIKIEYTIRALYNRL